MSVVAGDQQEGDKEDVILIQEEDTNQTLKKNSGASSVAKYPGPVLVVGIIIFMTTVSLWSCLYIPYYQEAGPLFWVLVGLLLIFHGLIGFCKTPESFILDITVNGKQISHNIPLRLVLVTVAKTGIGIAGVISMSLMYTSVWSILGLILSILLLLWVLVSIFSKQKPINMDFQKIKVSGEAMKKSEECCGEFLGHLVQVFNGLLPLPSISSLTYISQFLQQPRKVIHKPVHILLLVLAMVTCVVMFSAQVWLIAIRDCDREQGPCDLFFGNDPEDYFARQWDITFLRGFGGVRARSLVILTSTPIIFLLCIVLILMMKSTTVIRMLLFSLTTFFIGTFFLVFSICSVQYLIMMGVKIPLLFKLLTLVTLLPVPFLAAVFMALAYSILVQVWVKKDNESSSSSKTCYLTLFTCLSVVFIFVSLATMTFSIQVVTTNMQEHWNSTSNHEYDEECRDKEYMRDRYYDYYRTTTTTTTVAPVEKPEKCYGKTLDYEVLQMMSFFSISQEFVTESVMFLGLFVFLTGKRITKKSLFIHGILLFASTVSTFIAFFNVMGQERNFLRVGETSSLSQENIFHDQGNIFLMLNCINTIAPFIVGFICFLLGASCIISFLEFLFRTILSLLVFVCILFLSLLQLLLLLASKLNNTEMPHYSTWMSNEEPEVINA